MPHRSDFSRCIALAGLLLAACTAAPAAYTPAEVLPAEAQRVIDRATATAGAVATQVAQASATVYSAQATSTAAYRQTQDTIAMRATEQHLALLAAQATQQAIVTTDARTQAAGQTAAYATPTMAAMLTQAADMAARLSQEQASRESVAEFWRWFRWVTIGLVAVGGVCWVVVAVVRAVAMVRIETLKQKAAIARDAFRILPGYWAEWQPQDGYQVYPLPAVIDAPPSVDATATPDRARACRQAYRLFAWWGDRYGFGIRDLGPEGAQVVSDPDWRRLVKPLREKAVLAEGTVLRDGRKVKVTTWAGGWSYARFADELGSGKLSLPCPANEEPPRVAFTVPTQHHAPHNTTQEPAV